MFFDFVRSRFLAAFFILFIVSVGLSGNASGNAFAQGISSVLSNSALSNGTSGAQVVTEQVKATLLANAPNGVISPDGSLSSDVVLGLEFEHAPHWHTYWKNAGDSGAPTELEWSLPVGVMAGDIAWPTPEKIRIDHLANYGYEGKVILSVPLIITPEFKPSALDEFLNVGLKARWLVCRKECIPQEGDFSIKIPLRSSTALNGADFEQSFESVPTDAVGASASAKLSDDSSRVVLKVAGLPDELKGKGLDWFVENPDVLLTAAKLVDANPKADEYTATWLGGEWIADLPVSPHRAQNPENFDFVLKPAGDEKAFRIGAPVSGAWGKLAADAEISPALLAALNSDSSVNGVSDNDAEDGGTSPSWIAALFAAFIGGAILNLMPCVFPVLAIKVLGFTRHADDRRAHRISGIAYTIGVIASFVALGGLMIGLRAAGAHMGWGFQLQSPWVIAFLATLFTVMGLNLSGIFSFGHFVPSSIVTMQAKHPAVDSALSGVLAVAVASPCTAPFMGASLGIAMSLPTFQALSIFAMLGLGMAAPYLAASLWPAVARLLPKPGAWMEVFRRFMAFPMFATVIWLLWVLGQQSGINGVAALLAILLVISLLFWAMSYSGKTRIILASFASIALVWLLFSAGRFVVEQSVALDDAPSNSVKAKQVATYWQPWSDEAVNLALEAGQPVFVDFTAAWCVTCQYNKATTLSKAGVLKAFDDAGVKTFRADWTKYDKSITAKLKELGRAGVPVYLLLSPSGKRVILSEIITSIDIDNALKELSL